MAIPLRIELTGALYHITSRGDGRDDIFLYDDDRVAGSKRLPKSAGALTGSVTPTRYYGESVGECFPCFQAQTIGRSVLPRASVLWSNVPHVVSCVPAIALLASFAIPAWFAQKMGAPKAAQTAARGLVRTGAS